MLSDINPATLTANCAACGPVEIRTGGQRGWRCNIAKKTAQNIRNRKVYRQGKLIDIKGDGCVICGYSKCSNALEFHHVNPAEKKLAIARRIEYPLRKQIQLEIPKCILVCANCHREIHAGIFSKEFIEALPRAKVPAFAVGGKTLSSAIFSKSAIRSTQVAGR